jgi:phospholipid-transporting ATPase
MLVPLGFIVLVSAARAAFEDFKRYKNDQAENNRIYWCFDQQKVMFVERMSGELKVGDLVKVVAEQIVPADIVLLNSAFSRGHCFVETSSIDGETSLKIKTAVAKIHEYLDKGNSPANLKLVASVDHPNGELEQFKGSILDADNPMLDESLEISNLLLRGTVLKNTEFVYGLIVYTGSDTKIRQSVKTSEGQKIKVSNLSRFINRCIFWTFIFQFLLCLIGGIYSASVFQSKKASFWYLNLQRDFTYSRELFSRFFSWFIILAGFVPISYQVTSEIVKSIQAVFISFDIEMHDHNSQRNASVQNNSINDDLGQVEFIFSDKVRLIWKIPMLIVFFRLER